MNNLAPYEKPDLGLYEVEVELGFANSLEDPYEKPENDW